MARALLLLSIGLLASGTARAAPAAPLPPAEKQSVDAFAAAHGACREWSDGCVVCRRTPAIGFGCSTSGIACQPAALLCQDPKEEPAAPKPTPQDAH